MYAQYTRVFGTCKEPQKSIKFSPFLCGGGLIFKHPKGCFFVGFLFRATRFTSFRAKIRGPRGKLCTRGEKAHTSKRVSIIAPDNAISKVQCATCNVPKAHIAPKVHRFCQRQKHRIIAFISKVFYSALLFATDMRESHL